MASQFRQAVRQMLEAELRCQKCGAVNRPGAFLVRFEQDGSATCDVCGTNFTPELPR